MLKSLATAAILSIAAQVATAASYIGEYNYQAPAGTSIITFDEFAFQPNEYILDQYTSYGLRFDYMLVEGYDVGGLEFNAQGQFGGCSSQSPGGEGCFRGLRGNSIGSSGVNPVFLRFDAPTRFATFGMASNERTFTLTAYLDGSVVESFQFHSSGGSLPLVDGRPAGYYGIIDSNFDELVITSQLKNRVDNRIILDNIRYEGPISAVDEPPALILLGVGLAALLRGARKRELI